MVSIWIRFFEKVVLKLSKPVLREQTLVGVGLLGLTNLKVLSEISSQTGY
jgi:hypothetical protein